MSKYKISIFIAITPIIIFLVFWIGTILYTEILTFQHGDTFRIIVEEDTWYEGFGDIGKIKVLSYSDTSARVYCVWINRSNGIEGIEAESRLGGAILKFEKVDGKWRIIESETEWIWSSTGSADGFMWPYIR